MKETRTLNPEILKKIHFFQGKMTGLDKVKFISIYQKRKVIRKTLAVFDLKNDVFEGNMAPLSSLFSKLPEITITSFFYYFHLTSSFFVFVFSLFFCYSICTGFHLVSGQYKWDGFLIFTRMS